MPNQQNQSTEGTSTEGTMARFEHYIKITEIKKNHY